MRPGRHGLDHERAGSGLLARPSCPGHRGDRSGGRLAGVAASTSSRRIPSALCVTTCRTRASRARSSASVSRRSAATYEIRRSRTLGEYEINTVFHLAAQTIVGIANRNPISISSRPISAGPGRRCSRQRGAAPRCAANCGRVLRQGLWQRAGAALHRGRRRLPAEHPYDVSKSCADLIAQSYAKTWNLPVAVTRCGNFFGGGDLNWNRGQCRARSRSILRAWRAPRHPLRRSLHPRLRRRRGRGEVDLSCCCRAAPERSLRSPARAFNFSTDRPAQRQRRGRTAIREQHGNSTLEPGHSQRGNQRDSGAASRFVEGTGRHSAGWHRYGLADGMTRTIGWYRDLISDRPYDVGPILWRAGVRSRDRFFPRRNAARPTRCANRGNYSRAALSACARCSARAAAWCRSPRWCLPRCCFDYPKYPSRSTSRSFVEAAGRPRRSVTTGMQRLGRGSLVMKRASNDGYLLQHYVKRDARARHRAGRQYRRGELQRRAHANEHLFRRRRGGRGCAPKVWPATSIHANNVLAHVAESQRFRLGTAPYSQWMVLKPDGLASIEVPYLRDFVDNVEFDTIYHEHLYYFSTTALDKLFERHALVLSDVEHLPIHGGSLRLFVRHAGASASAAVRALLAEEQGIGLTAPGSLRAVLRARRAAEA